MTNYYIFPRNIILVYLTKLPSRDISIAENRNIIPLYQYHFDEYLQVLEDRIWRNINES